MDDAGSGARGPKPQATPAHVDAVARTWGLGLDAAVALGGSTSLNLRLPSDAGPVVVRIHRRHVSERRVEALQLARESAAQAGVPTALPIVGRDGERTVTVGATVVEVEPFVDSDGVMDTTARLAQAMPTFAGLHDVLRVASLPDAADDLRFANHLAADEVELRTAVGADRMRHIGSDLQPLADRAERLASELGAAQRTVGNLSSQWCHGDFWDDNVLFRNARIVLVADFGFLNRRPRIDDLALTLFFTLWEFLPHDPASDPLLHLAALVRAYDEGTSQPLSDVERQALPLAIARQPLWSIGVWAAQLDEPKTVRAHLDGHERALEFAEGILHGLDRWRSGFAR